MLFNSLIFIFGFLPLALAVTYALGRWRQSAAKLGLALLSLLFYAWSDLRHLPLLLGSFAFNYGVGILIRRGRAAATPRWVSGWLAIGVVADVGMLVWFKYAGFVASNLDEAFGSQFRLGHIALPLAISFFTFQQIAYLVDTARGEAVAVGALDFAVFAAFFPRLLAGPIVRIREVVPQLQTRRFARLIPRNLMIGLVMFAIGLFKKTVIADSISPYVSQLYAAVGHGGQLDLVSAWAAAISFTLQVYFDFSGYSDMALGLGRMFGVRLPLNFHSPLRAGSIIEYWRRWHMTLQRFVVSYIFMPLSLPLNRLAAARDWRGWTAFFVATAIPIFITFVILGIWHGAGWTFAVFGAMHGVYLAVNEAWRERDRRLRRAMRRAKLTRPDPSPLQVGFNHALTLLAVLYANVMFRAASLRDGVSVWGSMSGLGGPAHAAAPALGFGVAAALLASLVMVFFLPNTQQIMGRYDPAQNWSLWEDVAPAPISWTWKPSLGGLTFAGGVLFLGVLFIQSGRAVFLYYNF
jgi:D-alanyl-lipoteichoic acid acyltransferase DltB (MBOAT superfamily)